MEVLAAGPARRRRDQLRDRRREPGGEPARLRALAAPLRIAMLAAPWISVPASGYGGVESVVSALTERLVRHGHEVSLLDEARPDEIVRSLYEADHVARAFAVIDLGRRFDVVRLGCPDGNGIRCQ